MSSTRITVGMILDGPDGDRNDAWSVMAPVRPAEDLERLVSLEHPLEHPLEHSVALHAHSSMNMAPVLRSYSSLFGKYRRERVPQLVEAIRSIPTAYGPLVYTMYITRYDIFL